MAATYSPGQINPTTGELISAVRWLIQDIQTTTAEVADEEIEAQASIHDPDLSQLVIVYRTAAGLAQALERRYRKQATFSSGGTSVDLAKRAEAWAVVAQDLAGQAVVAEQGEDNQIGFVVGVSRAQVNHYMDMNETRIDPYAER